MLSSSLLFSATVSAVLVVTSPESVSRSASCGLRRTSTVRRSPGGQVAQRTVDRGAASDSRAWATSARMVSARAPLRRALRLTAAAVAGPLFTTSISQVPGWPTRAGPDDAAHVHGHVRVRRGGGAGTGYAHLRLTLIA